VPRVNASCEGGLERSISAALSIVAEIGDCVVSDLDSQITELK